MLKTVTNFISNTCDCSHCRHWLFVQFFYWFCNCCSGRQKFDFWHQSFGQLDRALCGKFKVIRSTQRYLFSVPEDIRENSGKLCVGFYYGSAFFLVPNSIYSSTTIFSSTKFNSFQYQSRILVIGRNLGTLVMAHPPISMLEGMP